MKMLQKEIRGLKVVIQYDRPSKYYLNKVGDIVTDLDEYRLNRMLDYLKGKKGAFTEQFTAINEEEYAKLLKADTKWLNQEIKRSGRAKTGGIATMLTNKGY